MSRINGDKAQYNRKRRHREAQRRRNRALRAKLGATPAQNAAAKPAKAQS
jgi:hypothetical protein